MIENLRKYSGLMIVVLVTLFISFFFLDTNSMQNLGSGNAVVKIDGRTYNEKDYRLLGPSSFELIQTLGGSGDYDLFLFLTALGASGKGQTPEMSFFVGRMLLRDAQKELGVYPSEDQVSNHLRSLRVFAGPDGKFSAENYRGFTSNFLGRFGMTERDLREIASDILIYKQVNAILGSGLTVDRSTVAATQALNSQMISGEVAKLDLESYKEKIQPTDEEVKAYWELISDSFTTAPRRKFSYVLVTPEAVADVPADTASETLAEAASSDEAKQEAAKKKEEERAKLASEVAEKRRENQKTADEAVDHFLTKLEEQKGAGFEELAKSHGWEIKTSELFEQSNPPDDLKIALRSTSTPGTAADLLFRMHETTDPFSKISDAIPVGQNQWIIARLDEDEKSRAKEFDEARDEARTQYIAEKSGELLKAAAEEMLSKIKPLVQSGKNFSEAAREAGLTDVKEFTEISSTYRPDPSSEPTQLFNLSRALNPGEFSEVVTEANHAFIIHVTKREVVKSADAEAMLDSAVARETEQNEIFTFTAWIADRAEKAKVEESTGR